MPKMKTKSSAKKRFRLTASGLVKCGAAGRRHGLVKRTQKMKRQSRAGMYLQKGDADIVKKFLPSA